MKTSNKKEYFRNKVRIITQLLNSKWTTIYRPYLVTRKYTEAHFVSARIDLTKKIEKHG